MKHFNYFRLTLLLICGISFSGSAQLLTETFETDGEGTRYTSNTFLTACNDFFTRMDNTPATYCLTTHPTNPDGSFYWGGEDTDAAAGGEGVLTLNPLAVTGLALNVDVMLAVGRPNDFRLEAEDYFIMEYNMDGAGWNIFGAFYGNNGTGSGNLQQDTNLDGTVNAGSTEIASSDFSNVNFTIPATGNSVQVRIRLLANTGTEEIVFDNIRINGTVACTDPTTPGVLASPDAICVGGSTTLTIIGTLNSATQWAIYSGNCGVTPVGTTAGSTFVVSPTSNTTYYVRGEGGCVVPSTSCGADGVTVNVADNASFSYTGAAFCQNATDPMPTITGLTGGTFSLTAGLSINASTGVIDVSASTPGTYNVTYTTNGPCPSSSMQTVTINFADNASFNFGAASYCASDTDPTPTITGLPSGSFSSGAGLAINTSTGAIDVSISSPGTYTVTYTTNGICPNTSSVSVTINALDDASFNYSAASYCANDSDPTPTITGLGGGTFSSGAGLSINASTGVIDVSASAPGTYTVVYTTSGPCPNSSSVTVTVNSLDDASFSYAAGSYCASGTDPTPTITGLPGGTFISGPGLSINAGTGIIDLSASTPGTYVVNYTTNGTCPNMASVSVTLNASDDASFSYTAAAFCANATDPAPTISGLGGGTFSGSTGLSINASTGTIDVSTTFPGTYIVTYTTNGPCPNSSNETVTVNPVDDASFAYSAASYCSAAADPLPASITTPGGTFSSGAGLSINATTGAIDLSASTPGSYTITYTTAGPCPNSSNVSLAVTALDDASFSYASAAYCSNETDPTPTITGVAGGNFSSTAGLSINASTGDIDLSSSTTGFYTVTYTTLGACANSSTQGVTVNTIPTAPTTVTPITLCPSEDVILTATGSGTGNIVFYDNTMTQIGSTPMPPATATLNVGALADGTYMFSATEDNGGCESGPVAINVTVGDLTAPTAVCQDVTVFLDGAGSASIIASDIDGGSTDDCGAVTLGASQTTFDCSNLFGAPANNLVITAAYDAGLTGGTPKGVELFVLADIADLSNYGIGSANNGGGTDGEEFTFPAVAVAAGTYIYVASEATQFTNFFGFAPDYTDGAMGINGDDAVELFFGGNVIDVFGDINVDGSGQPWDYLDGWASRNTGTGPDGSTFTLANWSFSGINALDGETTNATATTPIPVGTYAYVAAPGPTPVTLTVTDASGNTATCTANVTVSDTVAPVASCQDITVFLDGAGAASIVAGDLDNGSSDNCGVESLTASATNFTCADLGANTVTLTVTDASGNTSTCTSTVTVSDSTSPTASCQNITVFLDGAGTASIVAADLDNGSTDNCSTVTLAASPTTFTCADIGANTVTLTVTDGSGNTSTCTSTVTVSDSTAPTAVCQDITVFLDGAGTASIVAGDLDGGSSDNCSTVTFAATPTTFTCAEIGANTVTLTVTDGSGNTSTCTSTVTVSDTVSPTASCQDITVFLDGAGTASIVAADLDNGSSDNCSAVTLAASATAFTCAEVGANTVILEVTDASGNTSTCTSTVIVSDSTAPTAVCQDITVFLDGAGTASIVAGDLDGGSSDNCSTVTFAASPTSFTCAEIGANTVTLTVTDGSGNTSTCTSTVTVSDSTSPVITCPGDQTEIAGALCDFTLLDYTSMASSTDGCGTATITQSPAAGTVIFSDQVITMTATDGSGNISTCTFNVLLDVSGCSGIECSNAIVVGPHDPCTDQTVLTGSTVGGTPSTEATCVTTVGTGGANWYTFIGDGGIWTASTVSGVTNYDTKLWIYEGTCAALNCITGNDDFGGTAQSEASFATTAGSTYYVVVGGFDANEGLYEVTISNLEAIAPVPDAATLADETAVCEVTSLTAPTATDNCAATVTVTNDATFPITTQGTTVVTWTFDDGNGNIATQTQNVILTDVTAPVADLASLTDITAECEVTSLTAPTATDDCNGTVVVTNDATLPISAQGTTVVTWTYTDEAGNASTQTQNVILTDVTAPVADSTSLADVIGNCEVTSLVDPTATDNCSGAIIVTNDAVFPISGFGTTTLVTWTYDDGNGNTSTQTQNVTIDDFSSPLPNSASLADVTGECSVDMMPTAPTASDVCSGTITGVMTSAVTFPVTTPGITVITWAFDDGNGNVTTQSQNIIVNDISAPVPDLGTLADVTGICSIDQPTAPTATDNCSGPVTATTPTIFPITAIGTTVIVWEFVDANGNISTQTQNAINTGVDATVTVSVDGATITANTAGATYAWLNCDFNSIIAGETSQSFSPASNGNYAVIVSEGICSDTSACETITTVGIDKLSANLLNVYPNPSLDGYFTVGYEGTIEAIDVVDMLGRVIELPIDLSTGTVNGSELAVGRYMIRVRTEQSVGTTEIVIAR